MKLTLNLASRTYVNRRALRFGSLLVIGLLSALLVGSVGLLWRSQSRWAELEGALEEVNQQLAVYRSDDPALADPSRRKRLATEVARANQILARDNFRWTWLLDRLEDLVPRDVSIRVLSPDFENGTLQIEGWAREVGDLREFLYLLLNSPDFNRVFLLNQAAQQGGGSDQKLVGFSLRVEGAFNND